MSNAYDVVRLFEARVAAYCGAPLAVALHSCSDALEGCCRYLRVGEVCLPRRTYVSVPAAVLHAGGRLRWRDEEWRGMYRLDPYPVWDAALRFTAGMYVPGELVCVSFHAKKALPIGQGGAVLTDDPAAAAWLRRWRYSGRRECPLADDPLDFPEIGRNCYMGPPAAARGLMLLDLLPPSNPDRPNTHPDVSGCPAWG